MQKARQYLDPREVTIVVCHFPCMDGRGALAATEMFDTSIIQVKYDINADNILEHKLLKAVGSSKDNVVFFDCAPPGVAQLKTLRERFAKVMVMDHHYGNEKNLGKEEGCFFTYRTQ